MITVDESSPYYSIVKGLMEALDATRSDTVELEQWRQMRCEAFTPSPLDKDYCRLCNMHENHIAHHCTASGSATRCDKCASPSVVGMCVYAADVDGVDVACVCCDQCRKSCADDI